MELQPRTQWDWGIPKIHVIKGKAARALRGTAVLNCSMVIPAHCHSQRMDGAGEVFPGWALPPTEARENRHCHLLFTGCNRQAGAASEQNPAALLTFPACSQTHSRAARRVWLVATTAASSPECFSPGTTSSHSPGMSTQWDKSDPNQVFIHLYVYYFKVQYIHKV